MPQQDGRYPILNHPWLHYGVVSTAVAWTAGVSGGACTILCTAVLTVTLPDATTPKFRNAAFYIKNANVAGNITVTRTAGQAIDGVVGDITLAINTGALLVNDGANWWILANK